MDFWAGVMASFVLVKPQLLYLFVVTLMVWSIARRRHQVLLGLSASIIVSMAITLIFNPSVISQYIVMVREYPLNLWMTSTLGASLRLLIGEEKYYLQFIPAIIGVLWLGWYLLKTRESFDWVKCLPLIRCQLLHTDGSRITRSACDQCRSNRSAFCLTRLPLVKFSCFPHIGQPT
jgi:hypothetical protein